MQVGDWIYLEGDGASPKGDRPFLDRFNLKTLETERLFQCDGESYEIGGRRARRRRDRRC